MFSNENQVLFLQKDQKVLRNHYELQRFQNAISELRKMTFPHWKSQENGKSKSRSETHLFPNGNGPQFRQDYEKVLRIYCVLQCFQTADPDTPKPYENKWFWHPQDAFFLWVPPNLV